QSDSKAFDVQQPDAELTPRRQLVLVLFALTLVALVYGTTKFRWGTSEMAALFLASAMVCGIVAGHDPNSIAQAFTKGMTFVTSGVVIAGFTNSIAIILQKGQILDTIIY